MCPVNRLGEECYPRERHRPACADGTGRSHSTTVSEITHNEAYCVSLLSQEGLLHQQGFSILFYNIKSEQELQASSLTGEFQCKTSNLCSDRFLFRGTECADWGLLMLHPDLHSWLWNRMSNSQSKDQSQIPLMSPEITRPLEKLSIFLEVPHIDPLRWKRLTNHCVCM